MRIEMDLAEALEPGKMHLAYEAMKRFRREEFAARATKLERTILRHIEAGETILEINNALGVGYSRIRDIAEAAQVQIAREAA